MRQPGPRLPDAAGRRGMPGSREHASRVERPCANPAPQVQTGPEAVEGEADWLTRMPPTEDAGFGPVERERTRAHPAAGAGSDVAGGGGMARAGSQCAAAVARSAPTVLMSVWGRCR
ncbi:MAG TPA: hypothetical protein VF332_04430, partial [Vicinamibacterales bacterium]